MIKERVKVEPKIENKQSNLRKESLHLLELKLTWSGNSDVCLTGQLYKRDYSNPALDVVLFASGGSASLSSNVFDGMYSYSIGFSNINSSGRVASLKIEIYRDNVLIETINSTGKIQRTWGIFWVKAPPCASHACDDNYIYQPPTFEVNGNYPNGYNNFNHCDDSKKPQGYFYVFLNDIETAFEPFTLDVCYNSNRDKWQIKVDNNIKIRAITDICINNLGSNVITKIEEVDNISKELICDALVAIKGYKKYPVSQSMGFANFDFTEIFWAHELAHQTEFETEMIPVALSYSNFNKNLALFNLSCNDENDINDVKEEANELFNNALEKLLEQLRIEVHFRYPSNNPGRTLKNEKQNHLKVQYLVDKYEIRIKKRMKELNINCYK
ncbi:MAG: hypothetical protein KKF62_16115 [Bacteroidetes bacterium]|nr:hypothetical protein [Bacteroidota bacterium]MBU1114568.1 hypothetical protein [Bacteroidota bacterium]MBU1800245.1 hypothetical protein [Bacteroidota bacterium]